jgi:hypothetical protein
VTKGGPCPATECIGARKRGITAVSWPHATVQGTETAKGFQGIRGFAQCTKNSPKVYVGHGITDALIPA